MNRGFLKLSRRAFSHKFWCKSRVFSEFEAWVDLLQSARFDETDITEYVGERSITYGRGQLPASRKYLAKRWQWGEGKVRTFLDNLKRDGSIITDASQGVNVITICKYEAYNSADSQAFQLGRQSDSHLIEQINKELEAVKNKLTDVLSSTLEPEGSHNIKKEKKDKKEKESRAKTSVFTPPTLAQVEEYCRQRGNRVDADRFVDFYQSKGWMVGKNKMKDWQSAIRRWETSEKTSPTTNKPNIANYTNNTDYERF